MQVIETAASTCQHGGWCGVIGTERAGGRTGRGQRGGAQTGVQVRAAVAGVIGVAASPTSGKQVGSADLLTARKANRAPSGQSGAIVTRCARASSLGQRNGCWPGSTDRPSLSPMQWSSISVEKLYLL